MYRRFLVAFFRRTFAVFLLICLGCSAQSVSPELTPKNDPQVRSVYNLPPRVKIVLGPIQSSEFPNYDALTITLDGGDKKVNYDFLLSKDRNTLIRQTKLDLSKDPYLETMKKMDLTNQGIAVLREQKVVV